MRHINKKALLFEVLTVIALTSFVICRFMSPFLFRAQTGFLNVKPGSTTLYFAKYDLRVRGFDKNGATFLFLPSFIEVDKLNQGDSDYKILTLDGSELDKPVLNQIQDVLVYAPNGETTPWRFGLFKSENLNTMSISLNGIEFYEVDHDLYSDASLTVYSLHGKSTSYDQGTMIKGRGNGSWPMDNTLAIDEKRPFQIKLPGKVSFCGMRSSDKWVLIPNDETGIKNKLVYDLAADMGMEYSIESDWIDLYINNEYMGLYLLCHEPGIGSEDLDIGNLTQFNELYMDGAALVENDELKGYDYSLEKSLIPHGGYLIEKNMPVRYLRKRSGFKCDDDYFTIKSPWNTSIDEVAYIRNCILEVDDTLHGIINERLDVIDPYSFSRQFLITEISLNPDAAITSYFFYKKPNDERIYAGPCWDFDGAFGELSECRDYTADISDVYEYRATETGETPLDWDLCLVENEDYNKYVAKVFGDNVVVYNKLLSEKIDDYHDKIFRSLCMDHIRWVGYEDYEIDIRNDYKYLKFFLYNRFVYLSDYYGISFEFDMPDIYDDTSHVLTFIYEDGTKEEMVVKDGAQVREDEMPPYDLLLFKGWYIFEDDNIHGKLSYYDPVYEDKTLVLVDYNEDGEEPDQYIFSE